MSKEDINTVGDDVRRLTLHRSADSLPALDCVPSRANASTPLSLRLPFPDWSPVKRPLLPSLLQLRDRFVCPGEQSHCSLTDFLVFLRQRSSLIHQLTAGLFIPVLPKRTQNHIVTRIIKTQNNLNVPHLLSDAVQHGRRRILKHLGLVRLDPAPSTFPVESGRDLSYEHLHTSSLPPSTASEPRA